MVKLSPCGREIFFASSLSAEWVAASKMDSFAICDWCTHTGQVPEGSGVWKSGAVTSDPVSIEPDSSVSSMPGDSDPPERIWCGEKYSLPLCREKLQLLTKGVVTGRVQYLKKDVGGSDKNVSYFT